jgi:hypothetical protein
MPGYRVYIIGLDGEFIKSINLDCFDDDAALASARRFVDGHDVELWQRDRRIARLEGRPE